MDPAETHLVTVEMLETAAKVAALHMWADNETQHRVARELSTSFHIFALLMARRSADSILGRDRVRIAKLAGELAAMLKRAASAGELHPFGWSADVSNARLQAVEAIAKEADRPSHRPSAPGTAPPLGWTKKDQQIRELMRRMRLAYVELFALDWHRSVAQEGQGRGEGGQTLDWLRSLIASVAGVPGAPPEIKHLGERVQRRTRPLDLPGLIRDTVSEPAPTAWADRPRGRARRPN